MTAVRNTHGWTAGRCCPIDRLTARWITCLAAAADAAASTEMATGWSTCFTAHYYPQGGEFGNDTSSRMQARRTSRDRSGIRATSTTAGSRRSSAIPQLNDWVNATILARRSASPNTTGARKATSTARRAGRRLGIFGREGLDLATRWRRRTARRPPTRRSRSIGTTTARSRRLAMPVCRRPRRQPGHASAFGAQRRATAPTRDGDQQGVGVDARDREPRNFSLGRARCGS